MGTQPEPLILRFDVDDKGSVTVKKIKDGLAGVENNSKKAEGRIARFNKALSNMRRLGGGAVTFIRRFTQSLFSLRNTLIVTVGLLGAAGLVREFAKYDASIREIGTLTAATSVELGRLDNNVKLLSAHFGQLPVDTAKAFYQVTSAGYREQADASELLYQANILAVAGVTDVQTAMEGLIAAMQPYGVAVKDAEQVSNLLFSTVRSGITTIPELSGGLSQVTGFAKSAGISLREVLASIAAVTATTKATTGDVITQMVSVIKSASIVGDRVKQINKDLQLDLQFTPQSIADKGLVGTLVQVRGELEKIKDLNTRAAVLADIIPRVEGQRFYKSITDTALEPFREALRDQLKFTSRDAAELMMDGAQFQLDQLRSNFKILKIELGGLIYSVIEEDLKALVESIGRVSQFIAQNKDDIRASLDFVYQFAKNIVTGILRVVGYIINVTKQLAAELGALAGGIFEGVSSADGFVSGMKEVYKVVLATREEADSIIGAFVNLVATFGSAVVEVFKAPFLLVKELALYFTDQFTKSFKELERLFADIMVNIGISVPNIMSKEAFNAFTKLRSDLDAELTALKRDTFSDAVDRGLQPAQDALDAYASAWVRLFATIKASATKDILSGFLEAVGVSTESWRNFVAEVFKSPKEAGLLKDTGKELGNGLAFSDPSDEQELGDAVAAVSQEAMNQNFILRQRLGLLELSRKNHGDEIAVFEAQLKLQLEALDRQAAFVSEQEKSLILDVQRNIALEESLSALDQILDRTRQVASFSGGLSELQNGFGGKTIEDSLNIANLGKTLQSLDALREAYRKHYDDLAKLAEGNSAKLLEIEKARAEKTRELNLAEAGTRLGIVGNMFGGLNALLTDYAQASGRRSKELAIAQKALAIGQATINTALAITEVLAAFPGPVGFALAGVVAAMGGAQVGLIAATNVESVPTYHDGGLVRPGNGPTAGEVNAVLQPGEFVVSRRGVQALDAINRGDVSHGPGSPGADRAVFIDTDQVEDLFLNNTKVRRAFRQIMIEEQSSYAG